MTDQAQYMQDAGLAALPKVRHAFFTRNGGVSEGLYATLNVGIGSDDNLTHVQENRRRVAATMGVAPEQLMTLYQVHSARVLTVDAPFAEGERPEADGMVTNVPNLALGILTADCAPVLFADAEARVIGACHAGWKGAFKNIMEATVEAMCELGATRGNITATVGPCIGQDSYEVDQDFFNLFMSEEAANAMFFRKSEVKAGHHHFDLGGYVRHMLERCGIAASNLLAKDTCFAENAFFSNRRRNLRGEADYGRQVSAIMLLPE